MGSIFKHGGYVFEGISEGGIRTSIVNSQFDLMFDAGTLLHEKIHIGNLLITHGHLDHSAGIPHYVSQRSLKKLKPPTIILHEALVEPIDKILKTYSEIEDFPYLYNLKSARDGEEIQISKNRFIKPLKTYHRIPSFGYTVFENSKKLQKEYLSCKPFELIQLKERGIEISVEKKTPIFSYSGDSKIEYVLNNLEVRTSKILFLECTYIDDKRDTERARMWGHIHLDEIIHNAKEFQNEKIVLFHFSKRYSNSYIRSIIYKKIPDILKGRIHCFLPASE